MLFLLPTATLLVFEKAFADSIDNIIILSMLIQCRPGRRSRFKTRAAVKVS